MTERQKILVIVKPGKMQEAFTQINPTDAISEFIFVEVPEAESRDWGDISGVIAFGGDGTVLTAARIAASKSVSVIGLNKGSLGFLANYEPSSKYPLSQTASLFSDFPDNNAPPVSASERSMVKLVHPQASKPLALNEFSIGSEVADKYLEYSLFIGTETEKVYAGTHKANALLIASPSGSTAYALSAGGALVDPNQTKSLQLIAVAPFSMTSRPIVVGPRDCAEQVEVLVKVKGSVQYPLAVKADGQTALLITGEQSLIFQMGPFVKMLEPKGLSWYDTLVEKLHWGTRGGRIN